MIACPRCAVDNTTDSSFCRRCGARLSLPFETVPTGEGFGAGDKEIPPPDTALRGTDSGTVLQIRSIGAREAEIVPVEGSVLTIGRSPRSDLFLDDVTVSRHHARILVEPEGHIIEDLNSLNGTYVNRKRIERHQLFDGDELQVGKFKLAFFQQKTDE